MLANGDVDDVGRLLVCISKKREEMIAEANASGYTSDQTIKCSQELDQLLNQYQRLKVNSCKKVRFRQFLRQSILFFYGSRYKLHNYQ